MKEDKFERLNRALKEHASAMNLPVYKANQGEGGESGGGRSASAQITNQNKQAARNVSSHAAFNAAHPNRPASGPQKPMAAKPPASPATPKPAMPIKPIAPLKPLKPVGT